MATKNKFVGWLKQGNRLPFLVVIAAFLLIHVFVFRGFIPHLGDIAHSNASIVREELVPFFSGDQYMPASASNLTGSDEFRVTYSFWTSWMRQNAVLPYALVLLNTVSVSVLFYAIFRITRRVLNTESRNLVIYASALSALTIHLVLLYSKIAHFYTLIFGFSLFALSMTLVIEQLFSNKRLSVKNIAATSFLVLINPAVHYHVIFYLALVLLLAIYLIVGAVSKVPNLWPRVKRVLWYMAIVGLLSAIPYLLYIHATVPSTTGVFSQAPVNYWMIFYSSVPLSFLFSLDTYGHVDLYRYGNYLAPHPRYFMVIIFAVMLVGALLHVKARKSDNPMRRNLPFALLLILLISMWMSLGYQGNGIYSFHELLGDIGAIASSHSGPLAGLASSLIGVFINILRFPHRFEFIFYYMFSLLLVFGLVGVFGLLRRYKYDVRSSYVILALLIFVPFIATKDYRQTFVSGNFDGFLQPYTIPSDLKDIKTKLATQKDTKLFIMPSMESGRQIPQDGVNYTFLDKFYINYLDQPTVYYGGSANTDKKIVSFMVYRAMAYDEKWWQNVLVDDFGVTNILVPKNIENRQSTVTYMPGIEKKIYSNLKSSSTFTLAYSGKNYELYTAKAHKTGTSVMTNYAWSNFLKAYANVPAGQQKLYFPVQMQDFQDASGKKQVATDSAERTFYMLNALNKKETFVPVGGSLPFSKNLIASSNFTSNAFSLSTLYSKTNSYNYTRELVPSLLNLETAQFTGITQKSKDSMLIKVKAPEDGNYRLILNAASSANSLVVRDGNKNLTLSAIDGRPSGYIDFTYYKANVHLTKGTHVLKITDPSATILVESAQVIPAKSIPTNFSKVTTSSFSLSPSATNGVYNVAFPKATKETK